MTKIVGKMAFEDIGPTVAGSVVASVERSEGVVVIEFKDGCALVFGANELGLVMGFSTPERVN